MVCQLVDPKLDLAIEIVKKESKLVEWWMMDGDKNLRFKKWIFNENWSFKNSLGVGLGGGQVADGGEGQGGPVERGQVLPQQGLVLPGSVRIYPVSVEALGLAEQVVEAPEPVSEYQQYVNKVEHSPKVRVNCPRLDDVVELYHPIDLEEPGKPEHRIATEVQLEQVQGH